MNLLELAKINWIGKTCILYEHEMLYRTKSSTFISIRPELSLRYLVEGSTPTKIYRKIVDIEYEDGDYDVWDKLKVIFDDIIIINTINPISQTYIIIDYLTNLELL